MFCLVWLCFLLPFNFPRAPKSHKNYRVLHHAVAGQFFELTEGQLGNHSAGENFQGPGSSCPLDGLWDRIFDGTGN